MTHWPNLVLSTVATSLLILSATGCGGPPIPPEKGLTHVAFVKRTDGPAHSLESQWGPSSNGLQCLLKPRQAAYPQGEPFVFDLLFRNVQTNRMLMTDIYDVRPPPWIWTLRATAPNGLAVPYEGDTIVYCLTLRPIDAGAILNFSFALDQRNWDTGEPGEYQFTFSYESRHSRNEAEVWSGEITSQEVTVTRKPNKPSEAIP